MAGGRHAKPKNGVTTTHAAWGAGNPRLLVSRGDERFEFALTDDHVAIGSASDSSLQLSDTEPLHASVDHDERDEYVLTLHAQGEMNANPQSAGTHDGDNSETLRTGAHLVIGPWTLVFARDEFADHGRPFGGREGGEGADQPAQPLRPDYTDQAKPE